MKTIKTKKFDITQGDLIWYAIECAITLASTGIGLILTKGVVKAFGGENATQMPAIIDKKLEEMQHEK